MQMNGGFFGSSMPQGANSFMPQQPSAPSMVGGIDGSPSAFTQNGIDPKLLAMLKQLSQQGQPQGNPNGALPPNSFSPFMPGGGQPAPGTGGAPPPGGQAGAPPGAPPGGQPGGAPGQPPQMNGILQLLKTMSPEQIQGILSRLGIGGSTGAASAV